VEDARRDYLRLQFRIKIFRGKSKCGGQFFLVDFRGLKNRLFLRHSDALRPAILEADLHWQNSRARFLKNGYAPFLRGTTPSSASRNHVPMTGCPASFNSSFVVKMRKRASASSSVGFCTKTVSERFISRAIASISSSVRPSPSVKTASGLPAKRVLVKTSSV